MGNLLSILMYISTNVKTSNKVVFYKCPPSPDFCPTFIDQFLYEEDPFVFLSTPDAKIVTIEESDF